MKYADDKRQQAKHISDAQIVEAVRSSRGRYGVPEWATLGCVQAALSEFHPKVVQAKLTSAIRRGLLYGCTCGCRGDFEIPGQALDDRPWR